MSFLRHTIVGLIFESSDVYENNAKVVETKELLCKVKFVGEKIEVVFNEEDQADFSSCEVFKYGETLFERSGPFREAGVRRIFAGKEIVGPHRGVNDVLRHMAIRGALVKMKTEEQSVAIEQTVVPPVELSEEVRQ